MIARRPASLIAPGDSPGGSRPPGAVIYLWLVLSRVSMYCE